MTERKIITDLGRPLTVAELVERLADFEGDEEVYYGDMGEVRSATLTETPWGRVVILSSQPPRERQAPRISLFVGPGWWRRIVRGTAEAVRGMAGARVRRGPLGTARGRR